MYAVNITAKGEDIFKKFANDERVSNYNNSFFKIGNLIINDYDFYEKFGTLYDF